MGLFRRLFGAKKPAQTRSDKDRRRWSFARSSNPTSSSSHIDVVSGPCDDTLDASKHAIAVAAATAAVAEAALAAAYAAAEVVRLTSGGGGGGGAAGGSKRRFAHEMAAVRIQSAFRGYLARRALRALKALVKLQALVRGHIVRKQTAYIVRRMQTLVRLQARARASPAHAAKSLDSVGKMSRHSRNAVHASSVKDECQLRAHWTKYDGPSILKKCGSNSNKGDIIDLEKVRMGSNSLHRWTEESLWNCHRDTMLSRRHVDDEKSDKILEVDTQKPHLNSQQSHRNFRASQHFSALNYNQSFMASDSQRKPSGKASNSKPNISLAEVLSLSNLKYPGGKDEGGLRTADNSPQVLSASSRAGSSARRSPFTTTRSECSWGYLSGYPSHPNYMANTESSRAKYRSQSAPRQRLEFDKYGSTRRTFQGLWDSGTNSETDFAQHVDFRSRAHLASNRLNRLDSANQRD